MRHSLVATVSAALLTLPLAPAAVADPVDGPPDRPGLPAAASDTARERAEAALQRAQQLFDAGPAEAKRRADAGGADATMVLNQLMRTQHALAPADRRRAAALLARPTDGDADPYGDGYDRPEEEPLCGAVVCVHYVTGDTPDAPPAADADGNGVPDVVEDTLETAESVNATYTSSGYRRPDADDGHGGNDKVDVYLADIGDEGLYGYCTSDEGDPEAPTAPWNRWAYCVVDNDFSHDEFPTNTPEENRRVTLAHEYFHAIQYAYDAFEDGWFLEATAAWAEDELYDGVNDNRQYLPYGQLKRTRFPLDEYEYDYFSSAPYGQWIFFRYLSERWSGENGSLPRIVLQMWRAANGRNASAPDRYSTQAIGKVLAARGASFTDTYARFAAANRHPARSYEEGAAYPKARPHRAYKLGRGHRRTGLKKASMDHLTTMTVRYRARPGIRRGWRLKVRADLARRRTSPAARLVVTKRNGRVVQRPIRLNRKGNGTRSVWFNSRRVRFVELVLVNASRRMDCPPKGYVFPGTTYACGGYGRDDFRTARFAARIYRR